MVLTVVMTAIVLHSAYLNGDWLNAKLPILAVIFRIIVHLAERERGLAQLVPDKSMRVFFTVAIVLAVMLPMI